MRSKEIIKIKCDCKINCPDTFSLEEYEEDNFMFQYKDGNSGLTRRVFMDRDSIIDVHEALYEFLCTKTNWT